MKTLNWKLCLIADAEACDRKNLLFIIQEAVEAGVTLVQLRAKKLRIREFLEFAIKTSEILRLRNIPLIINDRIDIALSCEANGVHLGQKDLPLSFARKLLGKNRLIGLTVNTTEEAIKAEAERADYLGVGPLFFTSSKKNLSPILGLDGLKAIREKVKIPILAIGGINAQNAGDVIASGADGVAVISAILEANDISRATRELLNAINSKP